MLATLAGLSGLLAAGLPACAGPGQGAAGAPATSGSGSLVYANGGNIFVLGVDGKGRKQLTKVEGGALATDPTWSPDGARIAFSYSPPLPTTRGPGGLLPLPVTDVNVMDATGANVKTLLAHEAPGVAYETPVWLPDGKRLLVTYTALVMESNVVKDQKTEIARVTPGGDARQTLVTNGTSPTISPDGKLMAYIADESEGQALCVADVEGKNVRQIIPVGRMDSVWAPRFSPDGKWIAFSSPAPMAPIPIPTARPTVAPTPARRTDAGSRLIALAKTAETGLLAPLLAGRASAHGLPMDIFVVGVDGSNLKRLTQLGEDSPAPAWSPDGKRIAIVSGGGLYVMNADGSDLTSIDQAGGHGTVDWRR